MGKPVCPGGSGPLYRGVSPAIVWCFATRRAQSILPKARRCSFVVLAQRLSAARRISSRRLSGMLVFFFIIQLTTYEDAEFWDGPLPMWHFGRATMCIRIRNAGGG
jgi:hypothetical protein